MENNNNKLVLDLTNKYWEKITGIISEFKIDKRFRLRDKNLNDRAIGVLRIVSQPDVRPGYLRSIFNYIVTESPKTKTEIIKTVNDYNIDKLDLEYYNISTNAVMEQTVYDAPLKELEDLFKIKVF